MRIGNHLGTAFAEIDSLPGCSQIAVSHSAFVQPEYRRMGHGEDFHKERLRLMEKNFGYDYALCTVDVRNTAQLAILARNGWTRFTSFESSKTGNTVAIYGRNL